MTAPIRLQIRPSGRLIALLAALTGTAGFAILAGLPQLLPRSLALLLLGLGGWRALRLCLHGRPGPALCRLEWLGEDRWRAWRGDGRCAVLRLDRRSRRLGVALLLVFRAGEFGRFERPWALLLPHMVNDPDAARRLRARFTLDGARMRGLRTA